MVTECVVMHLTFGPLTSMLSQRTTIVAMLQDQTAIATTWCDQLTYLVVTWCALLVP